MDVNNQSISVKKKEENGSFLDLRNHFNSERSLCGRNSLHLNRLGKTRLGKILDDNIRRMIYRDRNRIRGQPRKEKVTMEKGYLVT